MVMSFADNPIALRQWAVTTKAGQRTRVALERPHDRHQLDRSLFNIELAAATLPLSGRSRPPGRPVLRRVEIDECPPPARSAPPSRTPPLAQHLARAAVAGEPRQRLEEAPAEQHRMPRHPVRADRPADLAPLVRIEGRDQPVDVARPAPPACRRAGSPPRPRRRPPASPARIEAAIPSAQSARLDDRDVEPRAAPPAAPPRPAAAPPPPRRPGSPAPPPRPRAAPAARPPARAACPARASAAPRPPPARAPRPAAAPTPPAAPRAAAAAPGSP